MLPLEKCNGMWISPLVDHLTGLLCKLAILADSHSSKPMGENEEESTNVDSAIRIMRNLTQLLKSNTPVLDSRNFAMYHVYLHQIRMWFKVKNYKQAAPIFNSWSHMSK